MDVFDENNTTIKEENPLSLDDPFSGSPLSSTPIPETPKKETTSKKSKWTPEEDRMLIESVTKHGMSNWSLVATEVQGRSGKQCRERWTNQLCPSLNKDNWTPQEDQILIKQQQIHGNMWSKIAHFLPGRSSNSVKNRWSWLSRHRLSLTSQMPFAQRMQASIPAIKQIQTSHFKVVPPIPQIYQTQQTCPQDMSWGSNTGSSTPTIPFSDPNSYPNVGSQSSSSNFSLEDPFEGNTMQFRNQMSDLEMDDGPLSMDDKLDTYWDSGF
ncbi:Myb-like DNA-binding domain containing protein [Trichomonas vaginalis G3]|uniref:Myb-like DNA-binding domain containing protein n=1 Tax=Trichomonas vaginalis (strain ATCC PRA-98 / G3) TaxID=412133 RepID=A2EJ17_TRIV3|nr:RNA polymerase II transcription regulator recruiting protein [Trichomonas vaginalis G3]EAY07320.1 Myb-like DNA-binding domain containing protein [Trichomonas vaginalis G3]KAI5524491.1 RNA polymerase II transcription regulator recruiting protein [Trichomonas vaginalis G3]|eukprot:XP_001319543.1 Myb-like DNA-binding domain containing protein [Trichomonas vaginalis G3]